MSVADYLPFAVKLLRQTGQLSSSPTAIKCLCYCVFLPTALILNLLIIYKIKKAEGDVLLIAGAFESVLSYAQLAVRTFVFSKHGHLIDEIIANSDYQWKYKMFGEKLESQFKTRMNFCVKLCKCLGVCSLGTITLMCVSAIFDKSKPVPLVIWIPNFKWSTEIIYIVEVIILLVAIQAVVATDSFYLLVGMDLQIQYEMMGELMKSINFSTDNDKECLRKITKCVLHHRWLMKLHQKLNAIFSEYFIVQYTITTTAVAMQIYIILYTSPSLETALKSIIYVITIMFQVALYFIPASNIEISAETFAEQLYMINWQNCGNDKICKHLIFMMLRSQKPLNMLGAQMLHINRPQYLSIIRLGFTIATILGGFNN